MDKLLINSRFIEAINYIIINKLAKSKKDIAKNLNMSPSKLSEILNKRMSVGIETLALITTNYNISPLYILTGKQEIILNVNSNIITEIQSSNFLLIKEKDNYIKTLVETTETQKKIIKLLEEKIEELKNKKNQNTAECA